MVTQTPGDVTGELGGSTPAQEGWFGASSLARALGLWRIVHVERVLHV